MINGTYFEMWNNPILIRDSSFKLFRYDHEYTPLLYSIFIPIMYMYTGSM